jgi:hypothetical protein
MLGLELDDLVFYFCLPLSRPFLDNLLGARAFGNGRYDIGVNKVGYGYESVLGATLNTHTSGTTSSFPPTVNPLILFILPSPIASD